MHADAEAAIEDRAGSLRAAWPGALLLALLVALVYANGLRGEFTFDDWHVIPENPAVKRLDSIPAYFTDVSKFSVLATNRDYRPLFMTSMTLCWWAGDGSHLPFRVVSIALHLFAVLSLFGVARRVLGHEGRLPPEAAAGAAWFGAALFAVHPLATESVLYASSQAVPLAIALYLFAWYAFLRVHAPLPGERAERTGAAAWSWRAASWTAFALALLAKPIAITLPVVLVGWDVLFARRPVPAGRARAAAVARAGLAGLRKHVPYALVAGAFLALRKAVFPGTFGGDDPIRPALQHYLTQVDAWVFYYLRLALWPSGQSLDREYPVASGWGDPRALAALGILAACAVALVLLRRRRSLVFFALLFPLGLGLTSFGVMLRQVVNEHRAYLSLAGVCVAASVGVFGALFGARARLASAPRVLVLGSRWLTTAAMLGALTALGLATRERNRVWSDDLLLWEDAAANRGTWRAHMNHALALEERGRVPEALAAFERALELGPYAFAHMNYGRALVNQGEFERGLAHLATAVDLFPSSPDVHLYHGIGLLMAGRTAEARPALERALELRPESMIARRYLAELAQKEGDWSAAAEQWRAYLALDPAPAWVWFNLGFALQRSGRGAASVAAYRELLARDPQHAQGKFNLAWELAQGTDRAGLEESLALFADVLAARPDYNECHVHRATALEKLGRLEEARAAREEYARGRERP